MLSYDIMAIVLPLAAAFVVSMLFAPGVIAMLKRRKVGQTISEDGPESHQPKAGTPTMGGLIIIAGMLGGLLVSYGVLIKSRDWAVVWASTASWLFAVLALVISYALLGGVDDYLTVHPIKGVRGIASKPKAAIQVLLAVGFMAWCSTQNQFTPVL